MYSNSAICRRRNNQEACLTSWYPKSTNRGDRLNAGKREACTNQGGISCPLRDGTEFIFTSF